MMDSARALSGLDSPSAAALSTSSSFSRLLADKATHVALSAGASSRFCGADLEGRTPFSHLNSAVWPRFSFVCVAARAHLWSSHASRSILIVRLIATKKIMCDEAQRRKQSDKRAKSRQNQKSSCERIRRLSGASEAQAGISAKSEGARAGKRGEAGSRQADRSDQQEESEEARVRNGRRGNTERAERGVWFPRPS